MNIITIITIVIAFNLALKRGTEKIEGENIFEIIAPACPKSSALKKIQAKTVNPKVTHILKKSLKVGKHFPEATDPKFLLLLFVNIKGRKYIAFNAPQAMNVQFAPCQKPLTMKITNVFLITISLLPRLPPM